MLKVIVLTAVFVPFRLVRAILNVTSPEDAGVPLSTRLLPVRVTVSQSGAPDTVTCTGSVPVKSMVPR